MTRLTTEEFSKLWRHHHAIERRKAFSAGVSPAQGEADMARSQHLMDTDPNYRRRVYDNAERAAVSLGLLTPQ